MSRQQEIFENHMHRLSVKTDHMFLGLLIFQWLLGIGLAVFISPLSWTGSIPSVHLHIFAAILGGGLISALPVWMILRSPGAKENRHIVAIAQIGYSCLFIHLTGGRIETHFHIFGSLAFLSFYRDHRPILIATVITAIDHMLRGWFWPESVYGVLSASHWRAVEHTAWVLFEDFFLAIQIKNGLQESRTFALHQAELENTLQTLEDRVQERTKELVRSQKLVMEQQQALVNSSKMSAIGELAGGMAHEINTPLAVIQLRVDQLDESLKENTLSKEIVENSITGIDRSVKKITQTINSLRTFALENRNAPPTNHSIKKIIDSTLNLCRERARNRGIHLEVLGQDDFLVHCRPSELSQVLLSLLSNSFDAVKNLPEKWTRITLTLHEQEVEICVTDSGPGIPENVRNKIMQPFFTTKEIGSASGLGLSVSKGIVEAHGGRLHLDAESKNTKFSIFLPNPLAQKASA